MVCLFLKTSMCLSMRAQEGNYYRGFNDPVPLGPSKKIVCLLRSVTLACNGIFQILVWGQNQRLSMGSLGTVMHVVWLSYRLNVSPSQTDMSPASANLAPVPLVFGCACVIFGFPLTLGSIC